MSLVDYQNTNSVPIAEDIIYFKSMVKEIKLEEMWKLIPCWLDFKFRVFSPSVRQATGGEISTLVYPASSLVCYLLIFQYYPFVPSGITSTFVYILFTYINCTYLFLWEAVHFIRAILIVVS